MHGGGVVEAEDESTERTTEIVHKSVTPQGIAVVLLHVSRPRSSMSQGLIQSNGCMLAFVDTTYVCIYIYVYIYIGTSLYRNISSNSFLAS